MNEAGFFFGNVGFTSGSRFLRRLHVAKRTPTRIFEFWPRASSHNLPCVASKIRRGAGARDTSCERRNVKRRVRKTGNPRRAHERETRRRQRTGANAGAARVRWFERKAITRSGARERGPHFATALAERAHERANPRRRRAVDLSGACTNNHAHDSRTTSRKRSNASAHQCRTNTLRHEARHRTCAHTNERNRGAGELSTCRARARTRALLSVKSGFCSN